MKDRFGTILYVGKAVSLKSRVKSYFGSRSSLPDRIKTMVDRAVEVDYIVTDSEVEALILECNLIKRYKPRFNVRFIDDKSYPYLKIDLGHPFPGIRIVRRMDEEPKSAFFGPYTHSGAVQETLRVARKLFPFRTCSDTAFSQRKRACLYGHIGRCMAPCEGRVSQAEYRKMVEELRMFLEGRRDRLSRKLRRRMMRAAEELRFEDAARLRDQLQAVMEVTERQKVNLRGVKEADVIGVAVEGDEGCGQVFLMREGKLIGREHFFMGGMKDMATEEILSTFIERYYSEAAYIPGTIFAAAELPPDVTGVLQAWLSRKRGSGVQITFPKKGSKRGLVEMAQNNASLLLKERAALRGARHESLEKGLKELAELLSLSAPPERIECFDISNTGGAESVGSMVVFRDGKPEKSLYRRFKVRGIVGPDDYSMLGHVLERRFNRADDNDGRWGLPDLVVVDGGKGQLGVAVRTLERMGVSIPVIGLAKREETVHLRDRALSLSRDDPALHLLQFIRDEAHRFAVSYHRKLRGKKASSSLLDLVPGIGPRRKKSLLTHFGSIGAILNADIEELASVRGMTRPLAERLRSLLSGGSPMPIHETKGDGEVSTLVLERSRKG